MPKRVGPMPLQCFKGGHRDHRLELFKQVNNSKCSLAQKQDLLSCMVTEEAQRGLFQVK